MSADSKTARALAFIEKKGSARTPEIAQAIGTEPKNVSPLLAAAVADGRLVTCKVDQPGKPPCNEYRIGGGVKPVTFREARPAVPTKIPPPAKPAAPGPKAAPPKVQAETAKPQRAPKQGPERIVIKKDSRFRCGIFSDGSLELILRNGDRIELPPDDTKALCAYLDKTLETATA